MLSYLRWSLDTGSGLPATDASTTDGPILGGFLHTQGLPFSQDADGDQIPFELHLHLGERGSVPCSAFLRLRFVNAWSTPSKTS